MAVRALGGRYKEIRAGVPTGLNPLATETDERGRAWLSDWLSTLLTRSGALSGEQSRAVQNAVNQNASAGSALRKFSSFETLFQSLDDDGELQSRVANGLQVVALAGCLMSQTPEKSWISPAASPVLI